MRTIILSGVSKGLGKAFVELLSQTCAQIVCIGRNFPTIQSNQNEKIIYIKQDLADDPDFSNVDTWISPHTKELIFINNAATIEPISSIGEFQDSKIQDSIAVNFTAPALLTNKLIAITKARDIKLRVLNISSGAATYPIAGWALYCASKAAAKMFFDCLQLENNAIQIKHIDPGVMDTHMQEIIRNASENQFPLKKKFIQLKQNAELRQPKEVAQDILVSENLL